jgi:hypothetical protein
MEKMMAKSTKSTLKIIRPQLGYGKLTAEQFLAFVNTIDKGLDGNAAYPNPPVPIANLKAAISAYAASMAAAADGSKTALSDRTKKREDLVIMLRLLGHYVESACNRDMTTFLSSGFQPVSSTRKPPQPLPVPTITKVDQGKAGELLVTIKPLAKARNYEIRFAAFGTGATGATPGPWTTVTAPSAKRSTPVSGLTAGTTYTFQVRAFGKLGYTDWSDSVMRMCI